MIKVADEIWVATALLHREHPERSDFTVQEIVERAMQENLEGRYRPGLQIHASHHCVASKAPNPASHRMLTATGRGRRRLFRPNDPSHAYRGQGKTHPEKADLPQKYANLVDWYEQDYCQGNGHRGNSLPAPPGERPHGKDLLKFVGSIPADDLKRMSDAIEEGCERIDLNEW